MDKILLRKNILDAELHKNLIIASTSAIIIFTYIIGLTIAMLSKQINTNNLNQLITILSLTSILISIVLYFFIDSILKIKRVIKALKKLKKQ